MSTHMTVPEEKYKLSPEALEFTEIYLSTLSLDETAKAMQISTEEATSFMNKKEVKRFIDTVFIEQGYMNKFKLKNLLEKAIESKLEEAEESGVYTAKDLIDLVKLMHDMRKDEVKNHLETAPKVQVNTQNNYGDNLSKLIDSLVGGPDVNGK